MMTYDDCPSCKNGLHRNCESDPEYSRFICTCPICNALGIANMEISDDMTKDSFITNVENMIKFIEEMDEEQYRIFKIMVNE